MASVFVHPVAIKGFEVVRGVGADAVNDSGGVAEGGLEEGDMFECDFGEL